MTRMYDGPVRNGDAAEPFHGVDVGQVVLHPGQVVDAVGIGDELIPLLALGDFFRAAVVVADVEVDIDDLLAVQLENAADDAVGAGMLRPQVEDHLPFVDPVEEIGGGERRVAAGILERIGRHLGGAEGVALPQRVPFPVVRHQDAAQVGVAAEADAVHVEHFPLIPVGGRKDGGDAWVVRECRRSVRS